MKLNKAIELAIELAKDYRKLRERGDVVLAEGARRGIEDLVGRATRNGVVLPKVVADTMGRPELTAPGDEVQS